MIDYTVMAYSVGLFLISMLGTMFFYYWRGDSGVVQVH